MSKNLLDRDLKISKKMFKKIETICSYKLMPLNYYPSIDPSSV